MAAASADRPTQGDLTLTLTNYSLSRSRAVVDESSLERMNGLQIDWASITADADGAKRLKAGTIVSRKADGKVQPRSFTQTLTSVSVTSNVATATKVAHGYSVGEQIYVSGANLAYVNGIKTIATVPDADTITFAATGANASATGTIVASRVATEMIETDATDLNRVEALSGYGSLVGGVFFENLLPDATGTPKVLPTQYKSELVTAGCTFKFRQYADSRAD
jgi:hypothetical protein